MKLMVRHPVLKQRRIIPTNLFSNPYPDWEFGLSPNNGTTTITVTMTIKPKLVKMLSIVNITNS